MNKIAEDAMAKFLPNEIFNPTDKVSTGSTDMGDLSAIMPAIHPHAPGASGRSHGDNYQITDPETACLKSAIWQLGMLYLLLSDEAKRTWQGRS